MLYMYIYRTLLWRLIESKNCQNHPALLRNTELVFNNNYRRLEFVVENDIFLAKLFLIF